ncbi:MAG: molybdopterin-dependent oxidoreductase [Gordonibacter sp.]|nr:molybdopterin-dependent oxidoreductase [Gordonibacter sp.]
MNRKENNVLRNPINRRSFIKGSAAAAAALGVGSGLSGTALALADEGMQTSSEEVYPGCCRGGCGGGCPMNVHVRDGKIVKTSRIKNSKPDTDRLCHRGLAHALRVYGEERLKYPMKRAGERGEDKWEQISWDEAIATITDKWKEVAEKHGPDANAFIKSAGNISPDSYQIQQLCAWMGATSLEPACDRTLYVAGPASLGYSDRFCGSGHEDAFCSKNILVWGWNPTESNSIIAHYILRAKAEYGANLVVIDPSYIITAEKADKFVPIQPGTDAVLALSMSNVLVSEGLADEAFLAQSTVAPFLVKKTDGKYLRLSDLGKAEAGAPEDLPVVRSADGVIGLPADIPSPVVHGTFTIEGIAVDTAYDLLLERVNEWPPEKASKVCDVPVETIVELAHMMADGPSAVAPGLGLDHYTNGLSTYAAIFAMTMVAGQFGKPGTGVKGGFSNESARGWFPHSLSKPKGAPKGKTFYTPAMLNLLDAGGTYKGTEINIKTLYCWSHNLLSTEVGVNRWREFLDTIELFVVADVVSTSTTNYADIVLPVCHYFECESATGEQTDYVYYGAKAAEPLYESKSDYDISLLLFDKMGLSDKLYPSRDALFSAACDNPVAKSINLTWDRIKKEKAVITRPEDYKHVYGEDGIYKTETGRLQFYWETIPVDGDYGQEIDFMKERLPYWDPPMEAWRDNPLAQKYPLLFTSERSKFKVHSQFTYNPWFLELESEPYVMVNPATCAERGIEDGDYIRLFNDRGSCVVRTRFNDGTRPGVITIDHGWEKDQFVEGYYCDLLGYNISNVSANSYYFDTLIDIEKATI